MTPTPRSRTLTTRAAQVGLLSGLTICGAALALPAAHAAPSPAATVTAQTAAHPVAVDRRAPRASRSRALAPKRLPMKQVTKTVAVGPAFSGEASWYGGSFQGQRTANGESFDTNTYTAASKTLPFGTRLRVCHDGCVTVRINDRGPYVGGRVLDLSRAAANAVGIDGVGYVTATPIGERTVSVVDTVELSRQRARARHAAQVLRSQQLRARAQALATAARQRAQAPVQADVAQPDVPRTPVAAGGGALTLASGSILGLRRKRS
jgi:rare lipoprotein A